MFKCVWAEEKGTRPVFGGRGQTFERKNQHRRNADIGCNFRCIILHNPVRQWTDITLSSVMREGKEPRDLGVTVL